MGFHGFLHLQITRLHRDLCTQLASRVDLCSRTLRVHGHQIPLQHPTVNSVFGLPCGGEALKSNQPVSEELFNSVCAQFTLPKLGRVSIYDLIAFLDTARSVNNEFLCKFLLFIIATMLRPTSNVNIYFREYIPLMTRLDKVGCCNWAKFVLDGVFDAVHAFQTMGCKSIRGCLLYLEIMYVQSITTPTLHADPLCLLRPPWLISWTNDKVQCICRLVKELGGIDTDKFCLWAQDGGERVPEQDQALSGRLNQIENSLLSVRVMQESQSAEMAAKQKRIMLYIEEVQKELEEVKRVRHF